MQSQAAAEWFDKRKHEFATTSFLDDMLSKYGDISNNSAEQMNSAVRKARGQPVLNMCTTLARRTSSNFYTRFIDSSHSWSLFCCCSDKIFFYI